MPCIYEELNAKINRLKRDGGIGYTEGGRKTISRKSDDLVTILGDIQAEKVSDTAIDLNTVESMGLHIDRGTLDVQKSEIVVTEDSGIQLIMLNEVPYIISVSEDMADVANKGTYIPVYKIGDGVTNCCMQFTYNDETIHPISDKYLPGPVAIDLDKYGISEALLGQFTSGGGTTTLEDVGSFWDDVNTDNTITVSFMFPPSSRVNVSGITTVRTTFSDGKCTTQLCFECIIDNSGTVYRVAAMIVKQNNGASVTVRVVTV